MSVQRYGYGPSDYLVPRGEGQWVTYADHARIVAEMQQAHAECICHHQNAAHYIGGVLQSFHIDGVEFISEQAHAAALAERDAETPIRGEHDPLCFPAIRDVRVGDWGPSCFTCQVIGMARHAAAPRTLTADDPEPSVGSVVLDCTGKAWALTRQKNGEWWWVTYDELGLRWDSLLRLRGPVTLIHDGEDR